MLTFIPRNVEWCHPAQEKLEGQGKRKAEREYPMEHTFRLRTSLDHHSPCESHLAEDSGRSPGPETFGSQVRITPHYQVEAGFNNHHMIPEFDGIDWNHNCLDSITTTRNHSSNHQKCHPTMPGAAAGTSQPAAVCNLSLHFRKTYTNLHTLPHEWNNHLFTY